MVSKGCGGYQRAQWRAYGFEEYPKSRQSGVLPLSMSPCSPSSKWTKQPTPGRSEPTTHKTSRTAMPAGSADTTRTTLPRGAQPMRRALLRRRSERRSPESGTTTSPGRRPAGAPRTRVGVARAGTRSLREQDGRSRDRGRGPRALSPGPARPSPPRRWRPHKDLALPAIKSTWIVLAVVARPRRQSLSGPRGRTPAFGCSELEPQGGPAATGATLTDCSMLAGAGRLGLPRGGHLCWLLCAFTLKLW